MNTICKMMIGEEVYKYPLHQTSIDKSIVLIQGILQNAFDNTKKGTEVFVTADRVNDMYANIIVTLIGPGKHKDGTLVEKIAAYGYIIVVQYGGDDPLRTWNEKIWDKIRVLL